MGIWLVVGCPASNGLIGKISGADRKTTLETRHVLFGKDRLPLVPQLNSAVIAMSCKCRRVSREAPRMHSPSGRKGVLVVRKGIVSDRSRGRGQAGRGEVPSADESGCVVFRRPEFLAGAWRSLVRAASRTRQLARVDGEVREISIRRLNRPPGRLGPNPPRKERDLKEQRHAERDVADTWSRRTDWDPHWDAGVGTPGSAVSFRVLAQELLAQADRGMSIPFPAEICKIHL